MSKIFRRVALIIPLVFLSALFLVGCSEVPITSESVINSLFPNVYIIIAQIISMVVLFIILYRYVWKTTNESLTKHQDKIKQELEEAELAKQDALAAQEKANAAFSENVKKANDLITEAKIESSNYAQAQRKKTTDEINKMYEQAHIAIDKQEKDLRQTIKEEVTDIAFYAVEKLLKEEVDQSKHEKLVDAALTEFLDK